MPGEFVQYLPITKVDKDQRMVWGYASTDSKDLQGEVVDLEAIKAALPDYLEWANIREMHLPSAVGITKEAKMDEAGLYIGAKIVDKDAWEKVKEGVYKGFSIGGDRLKKEGDTITELRLTEISLVDRPANPDCKIDVIKVAGRGSEVLRKITVGDGFSAPAGPADTEGRVNGSPKVVDGLGNISDMKTPYLLEDLKLTTEQWLQALSSDDPEDDEPEELEKEWAKKLLIAMNGSLEKAEIGSVEDRVKIREAAENGCHVHVVKKKQGSYSWIESFATEAQARKYRSKVPSASVVLSSGLQKSIVGIDLEPEELTKAFGMYGRMFSMIRRASAGGKDWHVFKEPKASDESPYAGSFGSKQTALSYANAVDGQLLHTTQITGAPMNPFDPMEMSVKAKMKKGMGTAAILSDLAIKLKACEDRLKIEAGLEADQEDTEMAATVQAIRLQLMELVNLIVSGEIRETGKPQEDMIALGAGLGKEDVLRVVKASLEGYDWHWISRDGKMYEGSVQKEELPVFKGAYLRRTEDLIPRSMRKRVLVEAIRCEQGKPVASNSKEVKKEVQKKGLFSKILQTMSKVYEGYMEEPDVKWHKHHEESAYEVGTKNDDEGKVTDVLARGKSRNGNWHQFSYEVKSGIMNHDVRDGEGNLILSDFRSSVPKEWGMKVAISGIPDQSHVNVNPINDEAGNFLSSSSEEKPSYRVDLNSGKMHGYDANSGRISRYRR